ncbi:N-acetyltransferase [Actinokineospora sp. NPDC004072]
MDLAVVTLAERPDLVGLGNDFPGAWPEMMMQDPVADLYYGVVGTVYAEYAMYAYDRDNPGRALAKAYSVPFTWDRDELPDAGWDEVIRRSALDRISGRVGDRVSALEICVQTDLRGTGLSAVMLAAMRDNARRLGHDVLVAPVRPNGKTDPHQPMADYAFQTRDDGLPVDPWLRVHVRAGGRIVRVAPRSMTISGTLAQWRSWTGLPFTEPGPVAVPDALAPVLCDPEQDVAVYIEPNVWVEHSTA